MIFSTADFQKGAVEYAQRHGIALIHVRDGSSCYLVRSIDRPPALPPWVPAFAGWVVYLDSGQQTYALLRHEDPSVLGKRLDTEDLESSS